MVCLLAPMSDSETEPESDVSSSLRPLSPTEISTTLAHLVDTPKTDSSESDPISAVDSAIKVLESLDFSLIRKDASLHGAIQESSTTLLEFLHLVLTMSPTSAQDMRRAMESLARILQPSFLKLMFQYRRLFHAIAIQELGAVAPVPIVISWVDAILAKLGDVASRVASAMHDRYYNDDIPEALRKRREEDNLRAAAQLPDRWDSIPSILTSEKASPAAKRLAIRLLVSLYVLQPQLIERSLDSFNITRPDRSDSMVTMLPHLVGFMQHTVVQLSECSPLHAQHQSGTQERMNCAMLLSLFALVDLTSRAKDTDSGAPFRPYTLAAVMRLFRFVMLIDDTLSAQTVVSPCPDLDAPRVVLVLWRHFVPWMWRLLAECNGSDIEAIVFLTTTWLYYAVTLDPQTISTPDSFADGEHGKCMICAYLAWISRLLVYLSSAPRPQRLTTAQTDVLLKICQYFVHWSDSDVLGIRKSSDCCRRLILLFVYLSCLENGHDAGDYVIHAMAKMQPRTLREGWKQVIQEDSSKIYDELEKSMSDSRRQLLKDEPDKTDIRRAKQFLDFFTIGCSSNIQISNQKSIIEFLEATVEYLRRESSAEQLSTLSTSFLSCLTAFQRGQSGIKICDAPLLSDPEIIWQVAMDSATPNLALASSFAFHIVSSRRLPEPLTQLEAWDFLREALLLIASYDYLGDESPLALVVNPSICNALSHLVRHADEHTAEVMQSSPWTSHLQTVLRRIQSSDNHLAEDYSSLLKKRISKPGTDLMNQITRTSDSKELSQAPPTIDIIPCRINGLFHLICVPHS
ncbi:hypothetical protein K503DRAFT_3167 [Rhizopogon vinicolor AM-OR11-026]|uniref:Uncharacterized protein n=1 Tax=Rhizopogon vinicolor AM-OR11-026 TaxID=1314800 RepID=A0A1B7NIL4_9AGAM|nr:hypothetical protein K503DRAFT_3167 [Rhizopogon vinicolor AM-OR11-026]